jgi:putative effector of murein hydrolase LrgA (UPF0299 family)
MIKSTKIVLTSAAVGFLMPALLLAFNAIEEHPSTTLATLTFYLCPPSVMSMGSDNALRSEVIAIWLIIAASNAVLYAIPAFLFVVARHLFRSTTHADRIDKIDSPQ